MRTAIPEPKYAIGQQVYSAKAEYMPVEHECPDCLGSGKWNVTTPAGETFETRCATCSCGYYSSGRIKEWKDCPLVQLVTIATVRIDSGDSEHPVEYMCHETGVGSGTIHHEERLFASETEAKEYAERRAKENAETRNLQETANRSRGKSKDTLHHKPPKPKVKT